MTEAIAQLEGPVTDEQVRGYVDYVRGHPVEWIWEQFGYELWDKQAQAAEAVRDHPKVAIRSANAVGKSFLVANLAHWYLESVQPGYVVITGASWTGIERVVWPWIHRLHAMARQPMGGRLLALSYERGPHWGAFSCAATDAERFAGFRTEHGVFVVVDEASSLTQPIHEAIMGLTATEGSRVIYIGNPLRTSGPFYEIYQRHERGEPGWHCMSISAFETPNVRAGRVIVPGLAGPEYIEDSRIEFGEGSAAWSARVLGEFPETGDNMFFNGEVLHRIQRDDARDPLHRGDLEYTVDATLHRVTVGEWTPAKRGPLSLWHNLGPTGKPDQTHNYVMGADIATGHGASNSVITVMDTTSREQVAQLASPDLAPHELAAYAVALGRWFSGPSGDAYLVWEANGPGLIFGDEMRKLGYGAIYKQKDEEGRGVPSRTPGWHSSASAKEWLLGVYRAGLARQELTIRSAESVAEALEYVYYGDGGIGPAKLEEDITSGARARHGDRVIADALALLALRSRQRAPQPKPEPPKMSYAWREKHGPSNRRSLLPTDKYERYDG